MTHYEERLERDLGTIRGRVADLVEALQRNVSDAVRALLEVDRELASHVILADHPINRAKRELDRLCHVFVARHLPSAGILRYISSVLRLSVELERIGDYAVGIARETVQLSKPAPRSIAHDLEMLADTAHTLLAQSVKAFGEGDEELARKTKSIASRARVSFDMVYAHLLEEGEKRSRPIKDLFALLYSFSRLDRICDQAKNICEETLFAVAGEVKQPKVYRILFLDERNDFRSVMAQAIARKAFPESGNYESAGWSPADAIRPEVVAFLDRHGHEVAGRSPRPLADWIDELAEIHVIVALDEGARAQLPGIPFHSVLVGWDVAPEVAAGGEPLTDEQLERVHKELVPRVRDLMETLRGELAT